MRTGLIAQKLGMSRVFTDDGTHVPVTVLKVDQCQAVAPRTTERDGYTALQVTHGHRDTKKLSKPAAGHFAKADVEPGMVLCCEAYVGANGGLEGVKL